MMKHTWILMSLAVVIASPSALRAEWAAPAPDQIEALLSAPAKIAELIEGATPEQAAGVVLKAIAKVDASGSLNEAQKKQLIARLVAYAVVEMGSQAPEMMALIVGKVDERWIQVVVAAGITAGRDYGDAMRNKILEALVGLETPEGELAAAAMDDPESILGAQLYNLVLAILTNATSGLTRPSAEMHNMISPPIPEGYIPPR